MPTFGELLADAIAQAAKNNGQVPLDQIRRNALQKVHARTGRPVIVYASRWMQPQTGGSPEQTTVLPQDIHGLMEVLHGLRGPSLDVILHSPGGSPTAAEAMVQYLRTKFDDIRVIVPLAAMSAATMIACASNRIMMGKHSYLGPIDPQFILQTPLGVRMIPAWAIKQQFAMAQQSVADPTKFAAWIPMLQQYGPGLLVECDTSMQLSKRLVEEWLSKWMFSSRQDPSGAAAKAASELNAVETHLAHGRFLGRDRLRTMGLEIDDLEDDQDLQDEVLTVFHANMLTFNFNPAAKIIENHLGKAMITGGIAVASPPSTPGTP